MKPLIVLGLVATAFLAACNTTIQPLSKALGVLEVRFDSVGAATAKLEPKLNSHAVTFRENDAVFGTGTTAVVNVVHSPYNYLVASFPVSHTGSSASAFQNLTLYALAKNGNAGDSAIKSITNFGGVTNTTEQARLARLVIPVHPVQASGNEIAMQIDADFQAFTSAEVTAAITAAGSAITVNDQVLNYGFSARCATNCTANSRQIPTNGTGTMKIAVRVPKSSTAYNFVMNFLVLDESVSRVTRGVFPAESIANSQTRGAGVGATRLMQFGLNRGTTALGSDTVDDVLTSKLNTSIHALDIGRISAGNLHTCGLTSSGAAYCWGRGSDGQLGNGTTNGASGPVVVSAPSGGSPLTFSNLAAGDSHACGLTTTGAAYCWGRGSEGQLGNGAMVDSSRPVAVSAPSGTSTLTFSSISAGGFHTCGISISSGGAAYCWGNGTSGQLGYGATIDSSRPVAVSPPSGGITLLLSSLAAGGDYTCGITLSGAAYCWGNGTSGRLGNGDTTGSSVPVAVFVSGGANSPTFSSIAAGGAHACSLTTSGTAYCWGLGNFGQLGNSATASSSVPVAVSAPTGGSTLTFSSIVAGDSHSCGLTTTGTAYCWGNGTDGRLGATLQPCVPDQVNQSCAPTSSLPVIVNNYKL
jgi:alpha-tubulin suppressor-like RCC1 family protein